MKIDFFDIASGAYRLIKNSKTGKLRYHSLYKKVTEYAELHYENATCSDLIKTENGWSCIVSASGKSVVLYISQTPGGELEFWEKQIPKK